MPKKLKNPPQQKPFWVRIVEARDEKGGLDPMSIKGLPPFQVRGNVGLAVHVEVPATATQAQGDRISKLVQEATGHPPILVTNNVRFMKLLRITNEEAAVLIEEARTDGAPVPEPAAVESVEDVVKKAGLT